VEIKFIDKNVVVVGGSRGIGLSIVRSFLESGAKVHVISRTKNIGSELELTASFGDRVYFNYVDATVEFDLISCSKNIINNCNGGIDILICNVGSGNSGSDPINEPDVWNQSWSTNFSSVLNASRVFTRSIKNGGAIIFISSIAGIENIGAPTEYSIAKSAIKTFAKILSHKLAPAIRVNTILPGNIYFEKGTWYEKMRTNPTMVKEMINTKVPLKKFGDPQDIANAVLFLSSDKASFITGSSLTVDGGQTIGF
jgi:3-oxoacyl-[acyl-carrier protein] reductase